MRLTESDSIILFLTGVALLGALGLLWVDPTLRTVIWQEVSQW